MKSLKISSDQNQINDIENFVEDICDSFHIQNLFHGNVIMALTELVSIVTKIGGEGNLTFESSKEKFDFHCKLNSIKKDMFEGLTSQSSEFSLESDYEKSIFLIMALADDFKVDESSSTITLSFIKEELQNDVSDHRKDFLTNYLGSHSHQKNKNLTN